MTDSDRAHVYERYPDWHHTCRCVGTQFDTYCEVDHLIPLELGGSNDVKTLWPQPQDPRPVLTRKTALNTTCIDEFVTARCRWRMRRGALPQTGLSAGRNMLSLTMDRSGRQPTDMAGDRLLLRRLAFDSKRSTD
jgi:hypothetical protein